MNRLPSRHLLLTLAAVGTLLLAACGKKLDGTYTDSMGIMEFTFASNGKVVQSQLGMRVELPYEVDGKDVRIQSPQGTLLLTLNNDGTIQGPMGMTLKRKP